MGDVWKALADPTRRKILELLKSRDMNAGEIAEHFNMTKPSISNHLNTKHLNKSDVPAPCFKTRGRHITKA